MAALYRSSGSGHIPSPRRPAADRLVRQVACVSAAIGAAHLVLASELPCPLLAGIPSASSEAFTKQERHRAIFRPGPVKRISASSTTSAIFAVARTTVRSMRRLSRRPLTVGIIMLICAGLSFAQPAHSAGLLASGAILCFTAAAAFYLSWAIPRWRLSRIARRSLAEEDAGRGSNEDAHG